MWADETGCIVAPHYYNAIPTDDPPPASLIAAAEAVLSDAGF